MHVIRRVYCGQNSFENNLRCLRGCNEGRSDAQKGGCASSTHPSVLEQRLLLGRNQLRSSAVALAIGDEQRSHGSDHQDEDRAEHDGDGGPGRERMVGRA